MLGNVFQIFFQYNFIPPTPTQISSGGVSPLLAAPPHHPFGVGQNPSSPGGRLSRFPRVSLPPPTLLVSSFLHRLAWVMVGGAFRWVSRRCC
ncbi:hypothetical protein QL285_069337 [Trifolium repens]|nr:hypothetical protein QL285_069337 [Trifolium repens]